MAFTEEQLAEISKIVASSLTDALPGALKAAAPGLVDTVEKSVSAKVAAQLEAAKVAGVADDDAAGGKGKGKGGEQNDAAAASAAAIARLEKQIADERSAREAAESSAKSEKMIARFRASAVAAGVPSERVEHALALLHNARGSISVNDAGEVVMKHAGTYGEELLPVADGLKAWIETDEGKAFLPPEPVVGSGVRNGAPVGRAGAEITLAELKGGGFRADVANS